MTARTTILIWAVYVAGLGAILVLVPNLLLALFGIPPTSEVWIRMIGMLLLIFAYYYGMAIRTGETGIYRWSVPARLAVPLFFAAFVLLGLAPPVLMLFAAADLAGALLTWRALRAEDGA